jgi:hypothetical protein
LAQGVDQRVALTDTLSTGDGVCGVWPSPSPKIYAAYGRRKRNDSLECAFENHCKGRDRLQWAHTGHAECEGLAGTGMAAF